MGIKLTAIIKFNWNWGVIRYLAIFCAFFFPPISYGFVYLYQKISAELLRYWERLMCTISWIQFSVDIKTLCLLFSKQISRKNLNVKNVNVTDVYELHGLKRTPFKTSFSVNFLMYIIEYLNLIPIISVFKFIDSTYTFIEIDIKIHVSIFKTISVIIKC